MKILALQGKTPRPRKPCTTDSGHDKTVADNVLARDFVAASPNQKWVADLTYIDTDEGWLYLAVVIDLFSRRVVGWSTADHMKADLVCEATQRALKNRNIPNNFPRNFRKNFRGFRGFRGRLVHHSDRGSQYVSGDFQQLLDDHSITCSMSRPLVRATAGTTPSQRASSARSKPSWMNRLQPARLLTRSYLITSKFFTTASVCTRRSTI